MFTRLPQTLAVVAIVTIMIPGAIASAAPATNSTSDVCSQKLLLTDGQVRFAVTDDNGKLNLQFEDDTQQHGQGTVVRNTDEVILGVDGEEDYERNMYHDGTLSFLADDNDLKFFVTPFNNTPLEPVLYSETVSHDNYVDSILNAHVEPVSIPDGAEFGVFLPIAPKTGPDPVIRSDSNDYIWDFKYAHNHLRHRWGFSTAGTYTFDIFYSAKLKDSGKVIESNKIRVTYVIGDEYYEPCAEAAIKPGETSQAPTPTPTSTPTREPLSLEM